MGSPDIQREDNLRESRYGEFGMGARPHPPYLDHAARLMDTSTREQPHDAPRLIELRTKARQLETVGPYLFWTTYDNAQRAFWARLRVW